MNSIQLIPKKTSIISQKHPWIFSGAISPRQSLPEDGSWVEVMDHKNNYLCTGHYQADGSISVRILSYNRDSRSPLFYRQKLEEALKLRTKFISSETTNAFRWIHGEGDGLPGLIIDKYDTHVVVQCHSLGMYTDIELISEAIQDLLGNGVETIYLKSYETLHGKIDRSNADRFLIGNTATAIILENGIKLEVNWVEGQKTGTFLDQRNNRQLLSQYGKEALIGDLFCNNGGFGLHGLSGGAKHVMFIDASSKAIDQVKFNIQHNHFEEKYVDYLTSDCLKFLQETEYMFDILVVDPPAFAKSLQKRHNAVQGYKRLNTMAMKRIKSGGLLFTFSCSQVIDDTLFYNTIIAASLESGRQVKVLHKLTQGPDHPVNIFHREGSYLKGLVIQLI
jgi:23S rRNA (cytosine1962-C5)-methyltransferase